MLRQHLLHQWHLLRLHQYYLLRQLDLYYQLILLGLLGQYFQLSLCFPEHPLVL
jgi:hypothetical protein